MKKYLEDLKKELEKLKLNSNEIAEILEDHEEMIKEAKKEGVSDKELVSKFGDPKKLASDLKSELGEEKEEATQNTNDYVLYKSFPVMDSVEEVQIKLVSDDVVYEQGDMDAIEVYYKNIKDIEDYDISFNKGTFTLKKDKKVKSLIFNISFSSKSGSFVVKVPKDTSLNQFTLNTVSGDSKAINVFADNVKIATTSGDTYLRHITGSKVEISTVSGDGNISFIKTDNLYLNAVSGDFCVSEGKIDGDVTLNNVSGDFTVSKLESDKFTLSTVSGDLNAKEFYPTEINLKSVSGDITITNEDKLRPIVIGKKKTLSGSIKIK